MTSKVNESAFNESFLKLLKDNCETGPRKRHGKKVGEKLNRANRETVLFFQGMTKIKNHQPQGVNNGKKFLKERNYILAKLSTAIR